MNLNLTGDPLYVDIANGFDERGPISFTGTDGSKGEWVECKDGWDFYIDDWHIMRLTPDGSVWQSVPQTDRDRLVAFIGAEP